MLKSFTAHITPFGKDRRVHIWLPENREEACPVMYFFDGHNLFRDEWATYGTCWGLEAFLKTWEKPLIVVAPECDQEGDNRLVEYAPYNMEIPPCGFVRGRGAELMDWLLGELKPWVDARYPTIPFRETTGIGGSSMGGLMAFFALVRYNQWISKAACLSSSFGFCYQQLCAEAAETALCADTRAYFSWGSAECAGKADLASATERNLTLSHLLARQGASTYPYLHVNGRHCEADWGEEIPRFMHYLWME